jgi:trans-2,3-dihydro-3-hydroxyanthranilate isomerase
MMSLSYHVVDVFTRTRFGGNPLAVVLDADDLSTTQMQAIAREFNYSETSFVLKPADPQNTAHVRIFTPTTEVPFAGHPNVGTGFVLAGLAAFASCRDMVFEERAGLVPLQVHRDGARVDRVELTAPQPLKTGPDFDIDAVAACLSLSPSDLMIQRHPPRLASVGLAFVIVELATRAALAAAKADPGAFAKILPQAGADAIYLYSRDIAPRDGHVDITARMFSPFDGLPEDPATGSATAAACALIARLDATPTRVFRVAQGIDMGRPSLLDIDVTRDAVRIGGACVPVMSGTIEVS